MAAPLEFYFDFSSPYGYIASRRIDDLAARRGRDVRWRPYLLGAAFRLTGMSVPDEQGIRFDYAKRDFARTARFYGVPYRQPDPFPILGVTPSRAYYALVDGDADFAKRVAQAFLAAYFVDNRNVSQAEVAADVVAEQGGERAALLASLQDQAIKDRFRKETEEAIARGVFGSPYIIVDGEPFWGNDRLDMIDKWLESGGW